MKLKWSTVQIRIGDLKPLKNNPRTITEQKLESLADSLDRFGVVEIPVVNIDYTLITSNRRVEVLMSQGKEDELIDVRLPNRKLTRAEIEEYSIISNVHAGEFDYEILDTKYKSIDLSGIGFEIPGFDDFLSSKEVAAAPKTKKEQFNMKLIDTSIVNGDLIEIKGKHSKHRILCGSCTSAEDVSKLMDGHIVDISLQSPPYNVGKTPNGNTQKYLADSDKLTPEEFLKLITDFTTNSLKFSKHSFVNIQLLAGNKVSVIEYLYKFKDWFSDVMIWDKLAAEPAMAYNVLNSKFEFVFVFNERALRVLGEKKFRGVLENIIYINSRQDKNYSDVHKATYPTEFADYFVSNFAVKSVADFFLGTGTTMVSAHANKKDCYGMEKFPIYCDVVVRRMLTYDKKLKVYVNGNDVTEDYLQKIL